MKKKSSWKTAVGLVAGALAFLKLSVDAPPPEEKKPEETGKEACIRWYGNLTFLEYQTKLFNLDIEYEQGRMDQAVYEAKRYRLLYCRNQQKVPGL